MEITGTWRKTKKSGNGGNCVEVTTAVRSA
jgi:hypothetical protein